MKRSLQCLFVLTNMLLLPALHATDEAEDDDVVSISYSDVCIKAAAIPAPEGEGDLKGNPKLREYCKCFEGLFTERALRSMKEEAPSLEETARGEKQMRNTCRKKFNLPLLK